MGRDSLQSTDRSSIGDISLGATYQLANTFGDTTAATAGAMRYRLAVNGTVRIGTGQPASRQKILDIGTGYGQPGVEIGGAADCSSAVATRRPPRFVHGATRNDRCLASREPGQRAASPRCDPLNLGGTYSAGNVLALSIIPRVRIAGYFAFNGQYSLVRTGADEYSLTGSPPGATSAGQASLAGLGAAPRRRSKLDSASRIRRSLVASAGPGGCRSRRHSAISRRSRRAAVRWRRRFDDQIELRVYFTR